MKNLIILSTLLFCSTVFEPSNNEQTETEELAHIVNNPHCCMNTYCIICTLGCAYCCWTTSTKNMANRNKIEIKSHKME
ncbi:hypothetical protein KBB68_00950 [Candidatus Babeliales bacterium]|nr:hypothetical protein [Candidatus Babeliales bacterium]